MQALCIASPERLLVSGPWGHGLPDSAEPGPTLGWMPEMLAFFDRHLRGVEAPASTPAPAVRWFHRRWSPPAAFPESVAGGWLGTDAYPIPGVEPLAWRLTGGALPMVGGLLRGGATPGDEGTDTVAHRPTLGTAGTLSWGAGGAPNGLGRDLRPDEALSLTYTSQPLAEPLDALGIADAVLHLSADAEIATVVVRLADVAPDGTSAQVSSGILNLTHRHSDVTPEPLVPGRVEEVRVPLRAIGYRWLAGHRVRVSVATQAWPIIWPSPLPVTLTVHRGPATPSRIMLPVIGPEARPAIRPAPPAETDQPPDLRHVGSGDEEPPVWRIDEDVIAGSVTVHVYEGGETVLEDGRSLFSSERLDMTAFRDDPARAILANDVEYRWREHAFTTEIRATGRTTSDASSFFFDLRLEVDLDGARFFEREWHEVVPRHLV
jgi:hypothetical protein